MNYLPETQAVSTKEYFADTAAAITVSNTEEPYILIIDDDPVLCKIMLHALEQQGMRVKIIADGQTAVRMLDLETKPTLIILDLVLPIFNGYEVLNQIRSTPGWKEIPVIVSSSNSKQEDIATAFDRGATDYLTKPVNFKSLCDRIVCYSDSVH